MCARAPPRVFESGWARGWWWSGQGVEGYWRHSCLGVAAYAATWGQSERVAWRTQRSPKKGAGEQGVLCGVALEKQPFSSEGLASGRCGGRVRGHTGPGISGCMPLSGMGSEWRQGRGCTSATRSRPVLTPKQGRSRVVIGGLPPPEAPSDIKGRQPSKARPKASSLRPGPAGTGGRLRVPRGWRQHMQTERFAHAFRFPPHLG